MLNLSEFNESQRQAICYTGKDPLLLLAGPGSGKTFTILHHLLYLQSINSTISFHQFFIISFTKQSAKELKTRYQLLCQKHGMSFSQIPWFGTFHSFFYQILSKANQSSLKMLSYEEQDALLHKALLACLPDGFEKDITKRDRRDILEAYSTYKNTLRKDIIIHSLQGNSEAYGEMVFACFERLRKEQSGITYDDILYDTYDVLKREKKLLKTWQTYMQGIFIDEFQDTNPVQYELLKLLYHKNMLCLAVGDDDQSIYGFRGSDPGIMKAFQSQFKAKVLLLSINYRSGSRIVQMSSKMIKENTNRFEKALQAQGTNTSGNVSVKAYSNELEQYKYISEAIKERGGKHYILYRTNVSMQKGAVLLQRMGINIKMPEAKEEGEFAFLIRDLQNYFDWIYEKDISAWKNIINRPVRNITSETLYAANACKSLEEFLSFCMKEKCLSGTEIEKLQLLMMQKGRAKNLNPFPCLMYIRKVMGYDNYIQTRYGKNEELKTACLETLHLITESIKENNRLEEWNAFLHTERKRDEGNLVTLMTMHASKGLECDTVWIPDCNEGNIPYGSLINPMFSKEMEEEERRLFYVGMTRAKKCLELSYIVVNQENSRPMSRFLNPLMD